MHEINTAAEGAITAAADPDANIIFGATISPELEGEIIITVVATGFDAAYFSSRTQPTVAAPATIQQSVTGEPDEFRNPEPAKVDYNSEQDFSGISMDVKDEKHLRRKLILPAKYRSPNIWSMNDDKDDTKPGAQETSLHQPIVSSLDEDELEKPSFLRRLAKRRQKH